MKLSEKLYQLRRQNGLSQEQAAERLDVSRQAVSKWESGQAVPDPDKLIKLSKLYGVTTDYLLMEDAPEESAAQPDTKPAGPRGLTGLILYLLGAAGLFFWGAALVFQPAAAEQLDTSSTVTIGGSGILAALCLAALAAGSFLLLRKNK